MTTTIISQELFDETILENEECFDLTPAEALRETIDQFCQQLNKSPQTTMSTTTDNHNDGDDEAKVQQQQQSSIPIPAAMAHLTLSHPATPHGQMERTNRSNFQQWLSLLDDCVAADGVVALTMANDDTTVLVSHALSQLAAKFKFELQSNNNHTNDNDDELAVAGSTNSLSSLPYLILFQQSCSIYTLMSFLTTILQKHQQSAEGTISTTNESESTNIHNNISTQQQQLQLLHQVTQTLTSILTFSPKENVKCAMVRGELRDVFIVGLNRLVGLLFRFVGSNGAEEGNEDDDNGANSNATSLQTLERNILLDLLKLSISAVRGCEGGKVAFVQSTLEEEDVVSSSLSSCHTKRGGVKVIWTILANTSLNSNNNDNGMYNMEVMEATCQLLTTLCRYDDFRTPSTTSNNNGAAAAAGGVSTSSAHDHAMEFHRVGVERLLIKVAKDVLNDLLVVYGVDVDRNGDVCNEKDSSTTTDNCEEEEEEGCLAKKETLAAAVLTALRVLAVNDEIIQTMVALGVLPIVTKALRLGVTTARTDTTTTEDDGENSSSSTARSNLLRKHRLVAASLGLIRNLCGNDEIKTNLCLGSTDHSQSSSLISSTPSALPHLLRAMQLYPKISPIQEHACGTLAAMALRRPSNARAIIDEDGPRLIITAMKRHEENVSVQRQGALAVRNIVSRLLRDLDGGSGDNIASGNTAVEDARSAIRDRFGELGVEDVLRNIAGRHQGSVDEAYAALRDLGYSVALTKFSAEDLQGGNTNNNSSNAIGRTMMFGEKHNSNFRPVYEQSAGLNNAVDEAVSNFGA